jgi:hypothetical protein
MRVAKLKGYRVRWDVTSDGRSKNGVLLEGGHGEDGLENGETLNVNI